MKRFSPVLSLLFCSLVLLESGLAELRIWTSTDGKTVEASFVSATDLTVTIRRAGGREYDVEIKRLAFADQVYIGLQKVDQELAESQGEDADSRPSGKKDAEPKSATIEPALSKTDEIVPLAPGDYTSLISGKWEKGMFKEMPFQIFGGKDFHGGTRYPLVLYLHSANARGTDNVKQMEIGARCFADEENFSQNPCFIIAPQCPKDHYWRVQARDLVLDFLKDVIRQLPVDRDRVIVTGHSMGGSGTFALITESPHLFAAAVPVSGAGDVNRIRRFKKLPMWIFHGDSDSHVNVSHSRKMVEALKDARGNIKYTECERLGHWIGDTVYQTPELHEWVFRQVRGGRDEPVAARAEP